MWHLLTFSDARYELEYMRYIGHMHGPIFRWKLLLSFTAAVLAVGKLVLLLEADYSLRWRALSAAVVLCGLAFTQIAAAASAYRSKSWFAYHHEHICVMLEVATVFSGFWWLTMMRPSELLPQQTPFTTLVCRGYMLLCDQLRLATAVPLLLFEGCVYLWLQLSSQPSIMDVPSNVFKYLCWGQVAPLVLMLYSETKQRWHFIQHQELEVQGLGCWPAIIETYVLLAHVCRQQLRRLQQRPPMGPMLLLTALLVALLSLLIHVANIFR